MITTITEWVSKQKAAEMLQVSVKTIERYIARGEIQTRYRSRAGKKPEPLCDPDDIDRIKQTPLQIAASSKPQKPAITTQNDIATFIATLLAGLPQRTAAKEIQPPEKRFLTLAEASEWTGLSTIYLQRQIREGKLPAVRDERQWKVRREDLRKI